MDSNEEKYLLHLIRREKWEVIKDPYPKRGKTPYTILVKDYKFTLRHPVEVHLQLYRKEKVSAEKYIHMIAAHNYLWPKMVETLNEWDERRFRAHCDGFSYVSLAGGAATGKSNCTARIACLFWLASPTKRAVIVASTTLDSLETRIWGYVAKFMASTAIKVPANITTGKPPKVLYPGSKDKLTGMFAIPVRAGESEKTISNIIGRHPEEGIILVLDEATDMSPNIIQALPNLEKTEFFQLWAIGNSSSTEDLHGGISTPAAGWDSIDPMRDYCWSTTHNNGICLYFNPYDSPAITDPDPEKRIKLAKFLPTLSSIEKDKGSWGEDSDAFYRFVLGFWKRKSMDSVVSTEQFLSEHDVYKSAEWAGFYPLKILAGLDPAFQVGGMGCVLRLVWWGQTVNGMLALDYKKEELLFRIEIKASQEKSGEIQLAENVVHILRQHKIPISSLAIDITGTGRGVGELIKLAGGGEESPICIVSSNTYADIKQKKEAPNSWSVSPTFMWFKFREFIQYKQVKGLDLKTIAQLTNRRIDKDTGRLESKINYKIRMASKNPLLAHSPDEADAAILAAFAGIIKYGFLPGGKLKIPDMGQGSFLDQKILTFEREQALVTQNQAISASKPAPLIADYSAGLEDSLGLSPFRKVEF